MANTSSKTNRIKLASFNLFNYIEPPLAYYDFENIYSAEQWQKKQAWLADFLAQQQPDIIGLQEVFSAEALAEQMQALGYEHFAVVGEPTVIDDYICRDPVVALASKYPFTEVTAIEAEPEYINGLGLNADFAFSRKPLRATVKLPQIGHCDVYVVHFKSKRPHLDELPPPKFVQSKLVQQKGAATASPLVNFGELLGRNSLGQWASSIQRGSEAALLFHTMLQRRIETNQPMVLMGDFNEELSSSVLSALTTRELRFEKEGLGELASYPLTDAYKLFQQGLQDLFGEKTSDASADEIAAEEERMLAKARASRAPTHYYGASGNVLDYILLSADFDPSFDNSVAEVCDYHTEDRHLVNPSFERDSQSSDHAPVVCTLRIRS
ncbi:endonuclease/exonuclease/phosphatase family protein [Shewanella pneumatophori]|uniref:Endonuclease/exonuclease/phosphatase family protein n=1 Tax=Shewanella pneumatophori TaxID=314092 RepID=A0A9X2CG85_9GAMM|nr:endonuclease/exonuclease/phosphatase family protein [Shewanella pneumatophori]MCL1138676.1 endonuclease/exonuclease/phosphatase family protein [Shewanella pneumatophori]